MPVSWGGSILWSMPPAMQALQPSSAERTSAETKDRASKGSEFAEPFADPDGTHRWPPEFDRISRPPMLWNCLALGRPVRFGQVLAGMASRRLGLRRGARRGHAVIERPVRTRR